MCKMENTVKVHPQWSEECWLPLLQLYLRKPVGVKAMYSRQLVSLSMDLHIPPRYLYRQMFRLRCRETPAIGQLWDKYAGNEKRLRKAVNMFWKMRGFYSGGLFYEGVSTYETFEPDFRAVPGCGEFKPVMLIMILELYFRLTPATMTSDTEEVRELAHMMRTSADSVVEVMGHFRLCDPFFNEGGTDTPSPLADACRSVWQRYGNGSPDELSAFAAQLRDYFK